MTATNEFFYIVNETPYATWYVMAKGGRYYGMGDKPSLFSTREQAIEIIADYGRINRNSGKIPSDLKIKTAKL